MCLIGNSIKKAFKDKPRNGNRKHRKKNIITAETKARNSKEYKFWRKTVYARDNHCCQMCGRGRTYRLNAHHIRSFKMFIHLRFEPSNGITLCSRCHDEFHNKFGKTNFPDIKTTKMFLESKMQKKKVLK